MIRPRRFPGSGRFITTSGWRSQRRAKAGVVSGETGSAGLAGLLALLTGRDHEQNRRLLGLTSEAHVVVISTEGATDPEAYKNIVGL